MKTLGISIARLEPGEVDLAMDYSPDLTQQNGFIHAGIITAGLDNACGIAAFTLMPAAPDILTVEFKTNLLAPARGERFAFRATVVKPGRTLTVCEAPRLCRARRRRDPDRDHERHADGAAAPRGRRAGQDARVRPDGLVRVAVQLCAAAMAICRKSFYGPAVQLSLPT